MAYQKIYMNHIHSSSLLCQLSHMWQRDILCDAVIHTGSTTTKAHRVVLVAACPMLQSMDGAAVGNKLDVKLSSHIRQESVTQFLRYLYDGFMMLTEDNVRDIEKIGRVLQVDSITKCCSDFYKVLETQIGKSVSHDTKFNFHADEAEFRHVRVSELLRSMQNGSEKRSADTDDLAARKRIKGQRSQTSPHGMEEQFEVVQVDTGPGTPKGKQLRSLAVSVASKSEPSPHGKSVHLETASDERIDQHTKQTQLTVSSYGSNVGTNKDCEQQRNVVCASAGKTVGVSRSVAQPQAAPSELVMPLFASSAGDNVQKTVQYPRLSQPSSSASNDYREIVIEPMEDEGSAATSILDPQTSSQGSYSVTDYIEVEEDIKSKKAEPDESNERVSVPGEPNTGPLSVVKVERVDSDDSPTFTVLPGPHSEDYGTAEEEGSDTDGYHGDAGPSTSAAEDSSFSWYKHTLKETLGSLDCSSGKESCANSPRDYTVHHMPKLPPQRAQMHFQVTPKNSSAYLTVRQKVVRALAHLKSPVAYLRNLQRKINNVKIDELKDFLIENGEDPEFENFSKRSLDGALFRLYSSCNMTSSQLTQFPKQISRYLNTPPHFKTINISEDRAFIESNKMIRQLWLSKSSDDYRRRKPMTQEDLNKLYESGVLSNDNPTSLQNKVWVELMIYVGGLGRQELRSLEKDHFIFEKDESGHLYFHLDAACISQEKKQITVYEQADNVNCPVKSLWLYLSKLNPDSKVFFQQPLTKTVGGDDVVWYSHRPIGKNAHSTWLANICREAGVTTEYRNQALYFRAAPVKTLPTTPSHT